MTLGLRAGATALALAVVAFARDGTFRPLWFVAALVLSAANSGWLVTHRTLSDRAWRALAALAILELGCAIVALGDRGPMLSPLLLVLVAWAGVSLNGAAVAALGVGTAAVLAVGATGWEGQGRTDALIVAGCIPMVSAIAGVAAHALRRAREDAAAHADNSARVELAAVADLRRLRDDLTGLLSRRGLIDQLTLLTEFGGRVTILLVDVAGVGLANVRGGTTAGDRLLRATANWLVETCGEETEVARADGARFAVLVPSADGGVATALADRIAFHELETPDGRAEFTVGVAVAAPGEPVDAALRAAEAGLRAARSESRRIGHGDSALRLRESRRAHLDDELRQALAAGQFVLHYQPIVRLSTGRIHHLEALVRWQHPQRGLLPPGEFVPAAEESGLIVRIGDWALLEACREAARLNALRPAEPVSVSVNITPAQAERGDIASTVLAALAAADCEASWLRVELTETTLVQHADRLVAALARLREAGVGLFLDDFGTGYSSLAYFRTFVCEAIKIDRSFITGFGTDAQDSGIVAALLSMARTLGVRTIAEGIETPEQAAHLDVLGCDYGQGYLFSRPLEAAAIAALLHHSLPAEAPKAA
jgi:EAL domain-containing protein (putative c-di-GMP-specific phosphodiesterase class I)/GGDEF domain-containing protein